MYVLLSKLDLIIYMNKAGKKDLCGHVRRSYRLNVTIRIKIFVMIFLL